MILKERSFRAPIKEPICTSCQNINIESTQSQSTYLGFNSTVWRIRLYSLTKVKSRMEEFPAHLSNLLEKSCEQALIVAGLCCTGEAGVIYILIQQENMFIDRMRIRVLLGEGSIGVDFYLSLSFRLW